MSNETNPVLKAIDLQKKFAYYFLVLMLFPQLMLAGSKITFETQHIHLSGNVFKYEVIDLNGDSLKEIIVFTKEGKEKNSKRFINILWQTETGFSEQVMQRFSPLKETIIFDFGEVVPSIGQEFVFLTKDGIYFFPLQSTQKYNLQKQPLFKVTSIFKNIDSKELIYWDFVKDINQDGNDEILIPQFDRYLIYSYCDSNGWHIDNQLKLPSKTNISSVGNISVTYSPQKLHFADCNMDGLTDIIAREKDTFCLFYQKADGHYSINPDLSFDMQFYKDEDKRGEEIDIQSLKDINGDGVIDMLATKISARESIFNPRSQIQIYFGKKQQNRLFSLKPDQIIMSSGIQFDHELLDFNNDDKIDLAIPSIKLGLMRIIKILFTKQVALDVSIYKMNEMGLYPEQPDLKKNLTIKFSFSMGEGSAEGIGTTPVFRLNGDFNGDGLLDLISAVDQKKFKIYKGDKDNIFSRTAEPGYEVTLPKNGRDVTIHDLDNNGKSDIVILYRNQDDKTGELQQLVRILINRIESN